MTNGASLEAAFGEVDDLGFTQGVENLDSDEAGFALVSWDKRNAEMLPLSLPTQYNAESQLRSATRPPCKRVPAVTEV